MLETEFEEYVNSIDTSDVTDEMRLKVFAKEWKETSGKRAANEKEILSLTEKVKELEKKEASRYKAMLWCSGGLLALFATSLVINSLCYTDEE